MYARSKIRGARYVRLIPWTLYSGSEQEYWKILKPIRGSFRRTDLSNNTYNFQSVSISYDSPSKGNTEISVGQKSHMGFLEIISQQTYMHLAHEIRKAVYKSCLT
jgi:hypothetical protein